MVDEDLAATKAEFVRMAWPKILNLLNAVDDPERIEKARVSEITTALGTLIDKAALLSGDATSRQEVISRIVDLPDAELEELRRRVASRYAERPPGG